MYVHVCSVQTTATVWASHHKIKDKTREMNMVYHNLSTLSNQETSTKLFAVKLSNDKDCEFEYKGCSHIQFFIQFHKLIVYNFILIHIVY